MPGVQRNHPAPQMPLTAWVFIGALHYLAGDRINTANGVSGIPFAAKLKYAHWLQVEDVETFIDTLTDVDDMYVSKALLKIKRMTEQNGKRSNN